MKINRILFLLLVMAFVLVMVRVVAKIFRPSMRDYVGGCRRGYFAIKYLTACFLHYFYAHLNG